MYFFTLHMSVIFYYSWAPYTSNWIWKALLSVQLKQIFWIKNSFIVKTEARISHHCTRLPSCQCLSTLAEINYQVPCWQRKGSFVRVSCWFWSFTSPRWCCCQAWTGLISVGVLIHTSPPIKQVLGEHLDLC